MILSGAFISRSSLNVGMPPHGMSPCSLVEMRPPLELHIMWIVDATRLNVTCAPIKGCVTIWTPHLGTPTQLLYHCSTFGTGFCILLEEFHSFDGVWVAFMSLTHLLVTVFTKVTIAETTKPILVHEPLTLLCGTLTDKLLWCLTHDEFTTMPKSLQLPVTLLHIFTEVKDILWYWGGWCDRYIYTMCVVKFYEPLSLLVNDPMYSTHRPNPLNFWLCLRHLDLFPLKEDCFPMATKFRVPKVAGTPAIHKLSVPHILTPHTMGVVHDREKVPL